jgi:hypothetical protein
MSISQLGQITGLPVLGGISLKKDAIQIEKERKESVKYGVITLGLMMAYGGLMMVDILDIKLFGFAKLSQLVH